MPYSKRQIINLPFEVNDRTEEHPAVILSVEQVFVQEEYYICAMISDLDKNNDQFTFPLSKGDTKKQLKKPSQIRTHLIAPYKEIEIISDTPRNHLTEDAFLRLIDHIDENVFGVPFEYA